MTINHFSFFQIYESNFTELISQNSLHAKGKIYELYPPKERKVFVPEITKSYRKARTELYIFLRNHLKIKPKYVKNALETMKKVAVKMKIPFLKLSFVGIHHRRTDITAFSKAAFDEKPFKKSYFYDAMEFFREDYAPTAFLYVSDDPEWGKKKLKNKHKDLFFVGKGMIFPHFRLFVNF